MNCQHIMMSETTAGLLDSLATNAIWLSHACPLFALLVLPFYSPQLNNLAACFSRENSKPRSLPLQGSERFDFFKGAVCLLFLCPQKERSGAYQRLPRDNLSATHASVGEQPGLPGPHTNSRFPPFPVFSHSGDSLSVLFLEETRFGLL